LENLAKDKRSSLLRKSVNYGNEKITLSTGLSLSESLIARSTLDQNPQRETEDLNMKVRPKSGLSNWRHNTQHNDIQHNYTQQNGIQHNDIQHYHIQHFDMWHDAIQHNKS
jgi:hypothetical protein